MFPRTSFAREKELDIRRVRMTAHGLAWATSDSTRYLIQASIFSCYVIWGLRSQASFVFKASVVMPTLQLILRLVGPLSQCSFLVHATLEADVSCVRYQKRVFGLRNVQNWTDNVTNEAPNSFAEAATSALLQRDQGISTSAVAEERAPLIPRTLPQHQVGNVVEHASSTAADRCITVKDAVFSWSHTAPHEDGAFRVTIPQLSVSRGQCVILLGHPGSGKSSVIVAFLGEMERHQGFFYVKRTSPKRDHFA